MARIRGRASLWVGAGVLLAACSTTPKPPPPSTDIDETVYREDLRVLASDDFAGRRPGTAGEEKTAAYVIEQFRKLGLKPAIGESYVQSVPMVEISTGADSTLAVAGRGRRLELGLRKDAVFWTQHRDPQVEVKDSDLVFVGYGIVAPEFNWNDYADTDVHGKTVVALVNDPGYATRDPKLFKGGAMTYYGRGSYKVEEALRQGAAGVLLIHDTQALGFGWNVVQNTWGTGHLALTGGEADAANATLEGWIQKDAARAVFTAAGLDFDGTVAAAARPGFKALPMGVRVDATLHDAVRQFNSPNVIATIPGSGRRAECVLYVAHWNHLGRDPTQAGHNIFNGATENASGVAGLLALAQSFARTRPAADRTIVFLAATGGEALPLGSDYYAANPVIPLRETAAVFNLDALHRGGPTRDLNVLNPGNTDMEELARGAALLEGREVTPEPNPEWGLYYNSDSLSFARAGVPVLYVAAGLDDSARGPAFGRAQLDDYMAHRYRQTTDQYSSDWDVRGALDDLKLYYEVGNRVAHGRRFPRWYPNSEFRVSRDHRPMDAPPRNPGT